MENGKKAQMKDKIIISVGDSRKNPVYNKHNSPNWSMWKKMLQGLKLSPYSLNLLRNGMQFL